MKSWEYIIQTKREHIDFINKIIEAYEGIGNVRTLDKKNGLIKIITNSFFLEQIDAVIKRLIEKGINIEIVEKREWLGIL